MVDTKQIVAPIGPVVQPLRLEMVCPPNPCPPSRDCDNGRDYDKKGGGVNDRDRDRGRSDGFAMVNW